MNILELITSILTSIVAVFAIVSFLAYWLIPIQINLLRNKIEKRRKELELIKNLLLFPIEFYTSIVNNFVQSSIETEENLEKINSSSIRQKTKEIDEFLSKAIEIEKTISQISINEHLKMLFFYKEKRILTRNIKKIDFKNLKSDLKQIKNNYKIYYENFFILDKQAFSTLSVLFFMFSQDFFDMKSIHLSCAAATSHTYVWRYAYPKENKSKTIIPLFSVFLENFNNKSQCDLKILDVCLDIKTKSWSANFNNDNLNKKPFIDLICKLNKYSQNVYTVIPKHELLLNLKDWNKKKSIQFFGYEFFVIDENKKISLNQKKQIAKLKRFHYEKILNLVEKYQIKNKNWIFRKVKKLSNDMYNLTLDMKLFSYKNKKQILQIINYCKQNIKECDEM